MSTTDALTLLRTDPVTRTLLDSSIPARLAYVALDSTPRAIPIAFHFTGDNLVLATAEGAPKVAALQANPSVAITIDTNDQPPHALLLRGTASVSMVDGVVPEYLQATQRMIPPEHWEAFRTQVTALYDRMARIEITPTWATVFDFETRAPQAVMQLAQAKCLTP